MSTTIAELMNEKYDRAAGRWCEVCDQYGSHHTDKHDKFAESL